MWGGRFKSGPGELMQAINASVRFDQRLAEQDIAGSLAHSDMLAAQGIISEADRDAIHEGLLAIREDIRAGRFEFRHELEDIHLNIEDALRKRIGEAAGRLHTGRSRNDQVATDFRLWVRDRVDATIEQLRELQRACLAQAEAHAGTLMPGFTHLQVAQPVTFGHHMMAYLEMFARDEARFRDARARLNESPLGAAALAGTPYPLDRDATASALGFDRPMANSLDAVSARDFALETLSAASICATHMSRLAEEIVIWTSAQFRFVSLPDHLTTGSSIMPQKRNPDAAELVRAKVGRILGAQVALSVVMKGLPLAYSKDMQEDKEPVFDALESLDIALAATEAMVREMVTNAERLAEAAGAAFSTATDLADWLVRELNIPFRDAHHITGQAVAMAEERGAKLHELSIADLRSIHADITDGVYSVLSPEDSVASRTSYGGTSPERVRQQVERWKTKLA